jgi:hypothetical protein
MAACTAEHKPDLSLADQYNRTALEHAASWYGLEGVKLLLQEGCPLPEGGVPRLVQFLRGDSALSKISVSAWLVALTCSSLPDPCM